MYALLQPGIGSSLETSLSHVSLLLAGVMTSGWMTVRTYVVPGGIDAKYRLVGGGSKNDGNITKSQYYSNE